MVYGGAFGYGTFLTIGLFYTTILFIVQKGKLAMWWVHMQRFFCVVTVNFFSK